MQVAETDTRDGNSWRRVGVLAQWWEGKDGKWHGWAPPQKPKAKKGQQQGNMHPSGHQQPLEQVIHAANVWIRACEINMYRNFEDLDASIFDGDYMCAEFFSDPPQSFLDAAPDYGKACIKRQLSALPLIQRLLTPAEHAAMLTDADRQAERVYRRAGMDCWDAFAEAGFEECWCAWVVEEVERALAYVIIGGVPLCTSVPATLDPWHDSDWTKSKRYLPRCTLDMWLERHEKWLGAPIITLFRTARARVVEATLCSSSIIIPQSSHITASASRSAAAATTTVRTGAGARTVTTHVAPSTLLATGRTLDILATAATMQTAPPLASQAASSAAFTINASTVHSSATASSDGTDEASASTGTRKRTTKAWVRTDRVVTRRTAKARTLVAARDRVLGELFLVKLIAQF